MMACTSNDNCQHWAQWRVTAPEKDAKGKIVRLKTIAILCSQHKKEMEKLALNNEPAIDLRFNFVGAVPDGSYSPQS